MHKSEKSFFVFTCSSNSRLTLWMQYESKTRSRLICFLLSPPLSEDPSKHYFIRLIRCRWRIQKFSYYRTYIQGIESLHRYFIVYRDITLLNAMLDGSWLYPKGFHPAKTWMNESDIG
ncbi:hypothetical protein IW262DRAFT_901156 [Armillaria fumosa]|nr:hypothetical protein IW262DRAFT_901156 [Armillaria fumosa]